MPFTRSAPLRTLQERPGPSPYAFIHPSAWKECSKKLPCENKGKANEEEAHDPAARGGDRLGRLHRPQPADGGEGKVRRLRREAARASGDRVLLGWGMVELAGTDADRVLNAMEDFAGYHRS